MVSIRISGNPTVCGLLALSAMEIVASQKPGSPLAILQQPTREFEATAIAASPKSPASTPQPIRAAQTVEAPSSLSQQAPGSQQAPDFSSPSLSESAAVPKLNAALPVSAASFSDLQSHWSQPFVELLATRGIVSGFADGTFQPDGSIQAAHFGMMLRQAKLYRLSVLQRELGLVARSTVSSSFGDRITTSAPAVAESEAAMLLQTHDIRTRAQAAVFIYRNLQEPIVGQATPPSTWRALEPTSAPAISVPAIAAPAISVPAIDDQPSLSPLSPREPSPSQSSPRLSEAFQWSTVEPEWVAQG